MLALRFTEMAIGGGKIANGSIDKIATAIPFCNFFLNGQRFSRKEKKNNKMDREKTGLIGILSTFTLRLQMQKKNFLGKYR